MAEMKKLDKSEKFWDRTAKNFDQRDDQYEAGYVSTIKGYLEPDNVVLDFACGTGSFSCLIANHVQEVHALDISSKMLGALNYLALTEMAEEDKRQRVLMKVVERNIGKVFNFL